MQCSSRDGLQGCQQSIASRLDSKPAIVPLNPNSLADIWDDMRRAAAALEIGERGERVIAVLKDRMRTISAHAQGFTERPSVACIEWIEPLMAAGNWMPELVEMAGGVNLFGEAGKHSPWMRWEDLADRDPDVIVVSPCGFDIERTRREMPWLTDRPGWRVLNAVRNGRVYFTDGNQFFNRPGPRWWSRSRSWLGFCTRSDYAADVVLLAPAIRLTYSARKGTPK